MKMEASVDQCRGPDWMPITPKTGSLFHAETHATAAFFVATLVYVTLLAIWEKDRDASGQ